MRVISRFLGLRHTADPLGAFSGAGGPYLDSLRSSRRLFRLRFFDFLRQCVFVVSWGGFRASWRVWRASRSNCGAAGRGAAGVGVGGSDCGTGVASGCCSVVVAVVGSVAAGAEADVFHANATRSAGKSEIQFAMA